MVTFLMALLQKLSEAEKTLGKCSLCHEPKQPIDAPILRQNLAFRAPFTLALTQHVDGFVALDGARRRLEAPNPNPGLTRSFRNL